jgi:hypothetical protein
VIIPVYLLRLQAGVALRVENTPVRFRVFPYENLSLAPFEAAVRGLNPLVAVKIRSASVHAALAMVYVFPFPTILAHRS